MSNLSCFNPITGKIWESGLNGPKGNVLSLSKTEIDQLPNISQVIEFCILSEDYFFRNGGWGNPELKCQEVKFLNQLGLNNPWSAYCNSGSNEDFIVTRLGSGRFALKPNLKTRPFLYRGQNEFFPSIVSGFDRSTREERIISNLKYAEFYLLLKTHPLFRLFDSGINLKGNDKTIFFEMNYYGLAQHYGFNTGLLDFSSDIFVSAFFGATKWHAADEYTVFEDNNVGYGVIYLYSIHPYRSFSIDGFSSIGLQVFPRSGQQKGFLQDAGRSNINTNVNIIAIPFRHDKAENQKIYDKWNGGKLLFEKDELTDISKEILDSKEISLTAVAYNLYVNPNSKESEIRKICSDKGYSINPHLKYVFDEKNLEMYYEKIKSGWWTQFAERIYWGDSSKAVKLKQEMAELSRALEYWQYFDKADYSKLYYPQINDELQAHRLQR